jgi:hypothetical protein
LDLIQQVAELVSQVYFSHAAVARQLTGLGAEEEIS